MTLKAGMKVKLGDVEHEVLWVGREVKLQAPDGSIVWRHSRTVERALAESKPAAKKSTRSRRKLAVADPTPEPEEQQHSTRVEVTA